MLATFTANLAAFLTVERMQTTIQNLEELARWWSTNTNTNTSTNTNTKYKYKILTETEPHHKFNHNDDHNDFDHVDYGTLAMLIMVTLAMMMIKKHLFRQSKINYTVLKDSPYMEYFKVASL